MLFFLFFHISRISSVFLSFFKFVIKFYSCDIILFCFVEIRLCNVTLCDELYLCFGISRT